MTRVREGMALLTVLLMVAVMAAIAAAVLDDVRFSLRRAVNADQMGQAQWYAIGAEALARKRLARLTRANPTRTPFQPDWNGRPLSFPTDEGGAVSAVMRDGQACFNLNGVVQGGPGAWAARPRGAAQLVALGRAVGLDEGRMRGVAEALTDWIDSDASALPRGAEDAAYAALPRPYRTSGTLLTEVSELRAVKGVDAEVYARLRPHLCALPEAVLSPINPNGLQPDDAPLLVMLVEGRITPAQARAAVAARPADGWTDLNAFWSQPALATAQAPSDVYDQLTLVTRFFDLAIEVRHGDAVAVRTALLQVMPDATVRTVVHRWTPEE
ncbi:MAG TPA: type II secretion system minor pseudopilin GspK [Brevundimonas sp.]|jgi:general secretion pathway protein K|uniref:type II secretion system minor pseudopilin GspK n=1 Tax=Brevundimonas sp. TaxID=1871086 RepID=UPI002DF1D528|nr:type II secretion system minor pseudopilin GspK [Brevundimonas sp.]